MGICEVNFTYKNLENQNLFRIFVVIFSIKNLYNGIN
jgi:hypothetical protein